MTTTLQANLSDLTPREAVIDSLNRCIDGLDHNSKPLFLSSLTPDAVFDVIGRDAPLHGVEAITSNMYDLVATLDTTHFLTGIRVDIKSDGKEAALTCHALAQHYRGGEGTKEGGGSFLAGTLYDMVFVKDEADGLWKWKEWRLKVVWSQGDMSVVMPGSS